ncbi:MAG: hypothetical protein IJP70_11025 [Bacteroidales bacterium]|nr:hypothetical protein [Bacteroidales bacterium]
MKRTLLWILTMSVASVVWAQNWDYIQSSGEYYYGVGHGKTEYEASEQAMADLVGMIATNVSHEFVGLTDETNTNGSVDHKTQVLNCVKTYSQSSLTNVEKWVIGKEPNVTVRRYMKRSELARIYDGRIAKAQDMIFMASESEKRGKVDMALQYYYWAYSLIRSVQRPNEVKDQEGHLLINWLPLMIDDVLSKVSVAFENRDGDYVDLLFNYNGKPVSAIEFTYSDGRTDCQGSAKDGRGMMEMAPGFETETYHVGIEYEYKGQAHGDAEMESVLKVIPKKIFPKAAFVVRGASKSQPATTTSAATPAANKPKKHDETGVNLKPHASQIAAQVDTFANITDAVIQALRDKKSTVAMKYFTFEGMEVFRKLIGYGTGRVVGTPNMKFFKSANGKVVARGLQMSFTFNTGVKKTFVEDVVLTFNEEKKIENVAFGLGQVAANDILCKKAPGWKDETREMLMEFLENYKTAYCLERLEYIRDIFADDAVIIVGNVTKRRGTPNDGQEHPVSQSGLEVISYNRYTKDEYLQHLAECFKRKEFINIRFSNNDIQWLEKYENEEIFAIQIGQEYYSSNYADKGYLFLLVNMTNHDEPQIKVRTWQPNEVDMSKLYNAGDFYQE